MKRLLIVLCITNIAIASEQKCPSGYETLQDKVLGRLKAPGTVTGTINEYASLQDAMLDCPDLYHLIPQALEKEVHVQPPVLERAVLKSAALACRNASNVPDPLKLFLAHLAKQMSIPENIKTCPAFHQAARFGFYDTTTFFLDTLHASPDQPDQDWETPLHAAVSIHGLTFVPKIYEGKLEVIRQLLHRQAKYMQDNQGRTPLDYVRVMKSILEADKGDERVIKFLGDARKLLDPKFARL